MLEEDVRAIKLKGVEGGGYIRGRGGERIKLFFMNIFREFPRIIIFAEKYQDNGQFPF